MTVNELMQAIASHDWDVTARAVDAPANFGEAVATALGSLDGEARQLAAQCLEVWNRAGAGALLLRMTGDANPQVAVAAANALARVADPPPMPVVLAEIPRREEPFVRGQLYKFIGATRDRNLLADLRRVASSEASEDAQRDALRALVMLGGQEERETFKQRVTQARPDEALDLKDDLLAIGDPRLARAMLPWLSSEAGVTRLGSDRTPAVARMCDVAVWTAYLLKLPFRIEPEYLANYSSQVIAAATAVINALPS